MISPQPLRFAGRYHNQDSDPACLGRTLWQLYHGHFQGALPTMLRFLIDEHPAGWSNFVGADFNRTPGFVAGKLAADGTWQRRAADDPDGTREGPDAPAYYCHGDRHDPAQAITQRNAFSFGCEFLYLFDEARRAMLVVAPVADALRKLAEPRTDRNALWTVLATVQMDGPEPDWHAVRLGRAVVRARRSPHPRGL